MNDWHNKYKCPICGNTKCVPPYDPNHSSVLLVGEYPEGDSIFMGKPFEDRTGTILRNKLMMFGYDLGQFAICNLWQHVPNNNPDCLQHGKEVVIKEAIDKKLILLIGSEIAKFFLTEPISKVNSLRVNDFLRFPLSAPVMAMYDPAYMFHSTHGEVILALQKFIREVEKLNE